jgi:hypothetical protein
VDVQKTGCRQREVSHWSNCVAGDFGALASLANLYPSAAILLCAWPHETLCDQLSCCFCAWERQVRDGLKHLEP